VLELPFLKYAIKDFSVFEPGQGILCETQTPDLLSHSRDGTVTVKAASAQGHF